MGWTPMEPDYATCGMTNWVGSFDPVMFLYFMLATVLIPYPVYVFVATVFKWEHRTKRPARHYQDVLHATSYGVIVFIFGNYAQTLNWVTILAFWITWPSYSLIAELDFAKTSLPSWKSWPFGMYALFVGATAVVLVFAGYHIYLGVVLNRTVPGFLGYYLLGLLIPVILTLIGYASLKQQNNDMFGLSKVYNWMLNLQWRREAYVAKKKFEKQQKIDAAKQKTIDPPVAATGESTGVQLQQQQPAADQQQQHPTTADALDVAAVQFSIQPYSAYVWSAATPGYFHPHHWQLFYTLAFFTRFDHWVSRVGGGITLACYMQGIMDLQPATIYARFSAEFPDGFAPTTNTTTTNAATTAKPMLRWLDSDGDWIEIRRDDKDFEQILLQVMGKSGVVHIQSGFTSWVGEPTTQLGTLMHRQVYEKVMDSFDHLSRTVVKLPPISNVLIVTKPDPKLAKLTKELSIWLMETFPAITLFIDKKLQDRSAFKYQEILNQRPEWKDRMQFWSKDDCQGGKKEKQIHLAVTLGGDGTVLYTTWMFQQRVPPIVAFHLGSLGFLTNFCFDSYKPTMTNIIRGEGMNLNIRMRLQCSVYKYKEGPTPHGPLQQLPVQLLTANGLDPHSKLYAAVARQRESTLTVSSTTAGAGGSDDSGSDDEHEESRRQRVELHRKTEIMRRVKEMDSKRGTEVADLGVCHEQGRTLIHHTPNTQATYPSVGVDVGGGVSNEEMMMPTDTWQVLNEVTVDRGSNAGMLQLELFVDGNHVTTILADGLVIATATGSTAYSLSIGGSLIHPDKNSIIISPIAPHSLTARPMIIPGTKHLRVCVPASSRTTAWASFDGRHRQELERGDSVMITASRYPATTICRRDQSTDWFTGLTQVLNWNSRVLQKPLESHL
ncbi:hypothetical protein BGW39_003320 [Mortierella sp. 14UC]|nr:hypothetical protein BGW39_003320 [Mortierella sp. 14UC]